MSKPIVTSAYVLIASSNQPDIQSIAQLSGKRIAVVKGYAQEPYLDALQQVTKIHMSDNNEGFQAVREGRADFFLNNRANSEYFLVHDFATDLKIAMQLPYDRFPPLKLCFAFRSGNTALYDDFTTTLEHLPLSDIERVRKRWFLSNANTDTRSLLFTSEERQWIREHPVVKVGSGNDWAPFNFIDTDGTFKGVTKDYLDQLSQISGLQFELHVSHWQQTLDSLKEGELDLLPAALYDEKREAYGVFLKPHIHLRDLIYARADDDRIKSFKDLSGKRLVRIKGYATLNQFLPHLKDVEIIEVPSTIDMIRAVLNNDADAFLESQPTINHILKRNMLGGLKSIVQTISEPTTVHFLVKKDAHLLQSILMRSATAIMRRTCSLWSVRRSLLSSLITSLRTRTTFWDLQALSFASTFWMSTSAWPSRSSRRSPLKAKTPKTFSTITPARSTSKRANATSSPNSQPLMANTGTPTRSLPLQRCGSIRVTATVSC